MIDSPRKGNRPEVIAPEIKIQKIDLDDIQDVEDNREAVEFSILLNLTPPDAWIAEFDPLYSQTNFVLKPPVRVDGDRIRVIFLPRYSGELQGFIRFIGLMIRRANAEYRRTLEMHTSTAQERRRAEFRDALKRIEIPE